MAASGSSRIVGTQAGSGVVTNGLVGYWDASNRSSYLGSGTTITDLNPSGNNQVLSGAWSYTTTAGGGWTFAATGSAGGGTSTVIGNTFSINVWVNLTSLPAIGRFVTLGPEVACLRGTTSGINGYYFTSGGVLKTITAPTSLVINTYYMITMTYDGSLLNIYRNGGGWAALNEAPNTLKASTGLVNFSSSSESMIGTLFNAQVYNRSLSATEVAVTYNAFRGRFGV
jgi:hypothetical protein